MARLTNRVNVWHSEPGAPLAWTMQQSSKLMDTNVLMTMLLQEVDQHYLRVQRCKHRDGKRKDEEKDKALVVDQSRGKK